MEMVLDFVFTKLVDILSIFYDYIVLCLTTAIVKKIYLKYLVELLPPPTHPTPPEWGGVGEEGAYYCRFKTFTFSSFGWIYDSFYINKVKVVPSFIKEYLSPLALAVWIMDDGGWIKNRGLKLATNCLKKSDVELLAGILRDRYDLKVSIVSAGKINQYCIYIPKASIPKLVGIVKPHIHPIFLYKFNL